MHNSTSIYQMGKRRHGHLLYLSSISPQEQHKWDARSGKNHVEGEVATDCDKGYVLHLPFHTEAEAEAGGRGAAGGSGLIAIRISMAEEK